tara:strand:- start:2621 stop:3103 length:483 start_codon:yes stop_codon:yes gene_type:complete
MKTTTENTAIKAEEQIDLIHKDHKEGYDLPNASLWVLNNSGNMVCRKTHPDVYELLSDEFTVKLVEGYDFFAILTCGWAAPLSDIDDGLPPSQSRNRRRVRLMVGADYNGVASVLRFADTPDEIISDSGKAVGAFADAVIALSKDKQKAETKMLEGFHNE